jgi:hypothetical protein
VSRAAMGAKTSRTSMHQDNLDAVKQVRCCMCQLPCSPTASISEIYIGSVPYTKPGTATA